MAKNKGKSDQWLKAALVGDLVTVEGFIASGINIETTGTDGRTALMNAAGGAHATVVQKLLSSKAKVNAKSNNGNDALSYLLMPDWAGLFKSSPSSDCKATLKALLGGGATIAPNHLLFAVQAHSPEIVEILVKTGRGAAGNPGTMQKVIAEAKAMTHELNVSRDEFEENCRILFESTKRR